MVRHLPEQSYSPSVRAAILEHLDKVVASAAFANSKRLSAFVRWVVEKEISGNRKQISERSLAVQVYKRGPDFDPKLDGTVRAEAIRLRNKLREYYEGASDSSPRIDIPKRGYVPRFTGFESKSEELAPSEAQRPADIRRIAVVALIFAACLVLGTLLLRLHTRPSAADLVEAGRLLERARELRREGEYSKARQVLERSIRLQPDGARLHLLYSSILEKLGYDDRAHLEALKARHLAISSAGAAELEYEARLRATEYDPAGAVLAYRFLADRAPADFDVWQQLADAQANALQFDDCIKTVEHAIALPEGTRNPELERVEALCRASRDDSAGALNHLKLGEAHSQEQGLTESLGRLMLLEGGVVQNYGGNSRPLLERASSLCRATGDELCQAQAARVLGNLSLSSARFDDAAGLYREALLVVERLHNMRELANVVAGLETVLAETGDLREADAVYTRLASGTPIANGGDMVPLRARMAYLRGDLNEAEVLIKGDLERFAHTEEPGVECTHRMLLGAVLIERGRFAEARDEMRRAAALIDRYKIPGAAAILHAYNAQIESATGNANRAFAELDAIDRVPAQTIPATDRFQFLSMALRIHLWEGDTAYIVSHATADAETTSKAGCAALAAEIWAMLAEAHFRAGNLDSASRALTRAQAGAKPDAPLITRLTVLRAGALLSPDAKAAERLGNEAVHLATHAGFLVEAYEGRLIRAERRWRDNPTAAMRELNDLRTESSQLGLATVADRVAKLSSRSLVHLSLPAEPYLPLRSLAVHLQLRF
jgi:tetratricopeptide (TPR) repeat protein